MKRLNRWFILFCVGGGFLVAGIAVLVHQSHNVVDNVSPLPYEFISGGGIYSTYNETANMTIMWQGDVFIPSVLLGDEVQIVGLDRKVAKVELPLASIRIISANRHCPGDIVYYDGEHLIFSISEGSVLDNPLHKLRVDSWGNGVVIDELPAGSVWWPRGFQPPSEAKK